VKRIVLTGGPGAGKTVVTAALAAQFPGRFALVPESATQVYGDLKTRWDLLDLLGRREVQRRIYRLQREQEDRVAREHPEKALLLDRGTIDGAAYWPDGAEDYWRDLGTDHATELARYDTVLWLETAATLGIYDGTQSNACRFEDPVAAVASGKRLLDLWAGHPHLKHVGAFPDFEDKLAAVREALGLS
jgi:nicotinamide riboside kinase